jgi:hypothetical protein
MAYDAYKLAIEKLGKANYSRRLSQYPNLHGYEFRKGNRTIWVVWSKDGSDIPVVLPTVPAAITDVLGLPQAVTGTDVIVTVKPLYIEW